MEPIDWQIQNEWSPLKAVMVGIGEGMGGTPSLEETYDPESRLHVQQGTYPTELAVTEELNQFALKLQAMGVQVLRPDSAGINQVFTRDIGVVIENSFIMTHLVQDRIAEQMGLESMLNRNKGHVIHPPTNVRMEGGDVIPMNDEIWVGYAGPKAFDTFTSARTNEAALRWLEGYFSNKKIRGFELNKSDSDSRQNALHLDCCCAPLGLGHLMVHRDAFAREDELAVITKRYPNSKILDITAEEMQSMHCNVFSITPETVVSNRAFHRTNAKLREWGYRVVEVELSETSKMGGLLRCSTLPLRRIQSP
jgi:N-dimethylarginine dimethylaminohydrolase